MGRVQGSRYSKLYQCTRVTGRGGCSAFSARVFSRELSMILACLQPYAARSQPVDSGPI